jgi:hypothetical protein
MRLERDVPVRHKGGDNVKRSVPLAGIIAGIFALILLHGDSLVASFWLPDDYLEHPPTWEWLATAALVIQLVRYVALVVVGYVVLSWSYSHLPGNSPAAKGMTFGVVLLFLTGEFISWDLAFQIEYKPLGVLAIHQATTWLSVIIMSVILSMCSSQRGSAAGH